MMVPLRGFRDFGGWELHVGLLFRKEKSRWS